MQETPVTLDILLDATPAAVWKAWTDPNMILKWFGSDPGGRGLKASLDVRVGGRFAVTFQDSDEEEHTCFGVYREVREEEALVFSWEWVSEPGVESLVTVLLTPENGGTQMHFEHRDVGDASAHDYLYGWRQTFNKLELLLRL